MRQTERHLHEDPPRPEAIRRLRRDFAAIVEEHVPAAVRDEVRGAIAVAGTATSCAAIELALDPYDSRRVHGHVLTRQACEAILEDLAQRTEAQRREVVGLHPDRAPTIIAGVAMLLEVFAAFGLERIEVCEHDLLRGAALALARASTPRVS